MQNFKFSSLCLGNVAKCMSNKQIPVTFVGNSWQHKCACGMWHYAYLLDCGLLAIERSIKWHKVVKCGIKYKNLYVSLGQALWRFCCKCGMKNIYFLKPLPKSFIERVSCTMSADKNK